jgi:hypothetical protein
MFSVFKDLYSRIDLREFQAVNEVKRLAQHQQIVASDSARKTYIAYRAGAARAADYCSVI